MKLPPRAGNTGGVVFKPVLEVLDMTSLTRLSVFCVLLLGQDAFAVANVYFRNPTDEYDFRLSYALDLDYHGWLYYIEFDHEHTLAEDPVYFPEHFPHGMRIDVAFWDALDYAQLYVPGNAELVTDVIYFPFGNPGQGGDRVNALVASRDSTIEPLSYGGFHPGGGGLLYWKNVPTDSPPETNIAWALYRELGNIDTLNRLIREGGYDSFMDLDSSGTIDVADRLLWISDKMHTTVGDVTLDGLFNSSDLVSLFSLGNYEVQYPEHVCLPQHIGWVHGDFNGDCSFNSGDLIEALATGAYEQPAAAVPEPSCLVLAIAGLLLFRVKRGFTRRD